MSDSLDPRQIRRLLDIGRSLVAQLDVERVLDDILDAARELTGARVRDHFLGPHYLARYFERIELRAPSHRDRSG
jgi:hypothetical protein